MFRKLAYYITPQAFDFSLSVASKQSDLHPPLKQGHLRTSVNVGTSEQILLELATFKHVCDRSSANTPLMRQYC